jgi:hypothetical protein
MLSRKPNQARFEFEIPGITNEVCFSDFLRKQVDDDSEMSYRLDRVQYAHQQAQSRHQEPEDRSNKESGHDAEDNKDCDEAMIGLLEEPTGELKVDLGPSESSLLRIHRIDLLREAIETLTDFQATAVWLWAQRVSERQAAESMGISQPAYHEVIFGKAGVGGVMRKLSKHFQKHPITLLPV